MDLQLPDGVAVARVHVTGTAFRGGLTAVATIACLGHVADRVAITHNERG